MSDVMDRETAELEALNIGEFFENDFNDSILPAVMAGRLYLDPNQKRVIYKLHKPIELQNDKVVSELKFSNPSAEETVRINKGVQAEVKADGGTAIDMGMMYQRTIKAAQILSGEPLGVINRMGRKDLSELLGFFDFL